MFRSMPSREVALGNRLLQSVDIQMSSEHSSRWSDDLEEDGGVEVTTRPNQSVAVDPRSERDSRPIRRPIKNPLPIADRAPQISAKSHGKITNPQSERDASTAAKAPQQPTNTSSASRKSRMSQDQARQKVSKIRPV